MLETHIVIKYRLLTSLLHHFNTTVAKYVPGYEYVRKFNKLLTREAESPSYTPLENYYAKYKHPTPNHLSHNSSRSDMYHRNNIHYHSLSRKHKTVQYNSSLYIRLYRNSSVYSTLAVQGNRYYKESIK